MPYTIYNTTKKARMSVANKSGNPRTCPRDCTTTPSTSSGVRCSVLYARRLQFFVVIVVRVHAWRASRGNGEGRTLGL
nr:hypothetical protein Itr_chr15CG15410 [Ipomoea trifida]